MGFRYTNSAIHDLQEIVDYIMADKPQAALAVADEIERICTLVSSMPSIGQPVDFITDQNYYMTPAGKYKNYLIFYVIEANGIVIHRIVHGRRNIAALFGSSETGE